MEIEGKYLLEALEHSVSLYNPSSAAGRFLQMSGKVVCFLAIRFVNNACKYIWNIYVIRITGHFDSAE